MSMISRFTNNITADIIRKATRRDMDFSTFCWMISISGVQSLAGLRAENPDLKLVRIPEVNY